MRRAVALAWRGWGRVGANPLVGAVALKGGRVLAEAYHAEFGGPHAEAAVIATLGSRARGAELVVTLEPCAHHGKTPPCSDAIVRAGFARVTFGALDPNPLAGGGAAALEAAGIAVAGGLLEPEIVDQNAAFFHRHRCPERPYVAVKLAVSLDARIADAGGRSRWVSGEEARDYAQWLRAGFEAVAVGAGTARADDPALTVRGTVQPPAPPLRLVFDDRAELPETLQMFRTARETPTMLVSRVGGTGAPLERFAALGVATLSATDEAAALTELRARGVASVLVEGGGTLVARLLAAGLVDRLYLIQAPLLLGAGGVAAFPGAADAPIDTARRWRVVGRKALGADTVLVLDRR